MQIYKQTGLHTYVGRVTDRHADGRTDTDRQTDRQTQRQTDWQAGTQTDRCTGMTMIAGAASVVNHRRFDQTADADER